MTLYLHVLLLFLETLRVFLLCSLVMVVGEFVIQGLTYLSGCVDEPKRLPRFDSVGDWE